MRWACRRLVGLPFLAMALWSGPGEAQGSATGPLRQAEALLGQGRPGAAAEVIRGSGVADRDPQAAYLLGFALIQLYRFPEAEAVLEKAVAARPGQDAWLHALAKARLEQGKNLAAMEALEEAIAIRDDPRYRYARAMCALNVGDLEFGRQELEATLRGAPGHADALYHLGKLAVDSGDYGRAVPRLRQALAANPRHLEARYLAGLAELRSGRPEAAVAEFETVLAEVPGHGGALYNLGRALVESGREAEGRRRLEQFQATSALRDEIEFLRRAAKRNPANLGGRLVLGEKLLAAGMAADALVELNGARDLDPTRADTYRLIGQALRRLGRTEEAARAEAFAARLEEGTS